MEDILGIPFYLFVILVLDNLFILILLFANLSNKSKIAKIKSRYNRFMNGLSDRNIEELLDSCIESINKVNAKNRDIESHINSIERNLIHCLQKIGVVRFNAFDNVGSDLSFSIALLDSNDSGIVISGLYSRDSSSTYAKPVVSGKSKYALSVEEIKAIDIAKKSYDKAPYVDGV